MITTILGLCTVFTGPLEWDYEGYPIHYEQGVTQILESKGYQIVFTEADAAFRLSIEPAAEDRGHFQFAVARAHWTSADASREPRTMESAKRCMTQLCAVTDFVPPLRKLMGSLQSEIPSCQAATR